MRTIIFTLVMLLPNVCSAQILPTWCGDPTLKPGETCTEPRNFVSGLAIGSMMVANGADLSTTMYALGTGRFQESNPLVALWFDPKHPALVGVAKAGVATATAFVFIKYRKEHPKLVTGLAFGLAGLYGGAAWHNSRAIRGSR